jgi:hypothetical protein
LAGVIYVLSDPNTGEPCYVGQTNNPERREYEHTVDTKGSKRKVEWIAGLVHEGKEPIFSIYKEVYGSDADLSRDERETIKTLRDVGYDLLNATDGGEVAPRKGRRGDAEGYIKDEDAIEWNRQHEEKRCLRKRRAKGSPRIGSDIRQFTNGYNGDIQRFLYMSRESIDSSLFLSQGLQPGEGDFTDILAMKVDLQTAIQSLSDDERHVVQRFMHEDETDKAVLYRALEKLRAILFKDV